MSFFSGHSQAPDTEKESFQIRNTRGSANVTVESPIGYPRYGETMVVLLSGLGDHGAITRKRPRHFLASSLGVRSATIAQNDRRLHNLHGAINKRTWDMMVGLDGINERYQPKQIILDGHSLGGVVASNLIKMNHVRRDGDGRLPLAFVSYEATPGTEGPHAIHIKDVLNAAGSLAGLVGRPIETLGLVGRLASYERHHNLLQDGALILSETLGIHQVDISDDLGGLDKMGIGHQRVFYNKDAQVPLPKIADQRTFIPDMDLDHLATHHHPDIMGNIISLALNGLSIAV